MKNEKEKSGLKVYVFNNSSRWETEGAVAIFSENKEQAEKIYLEKYDCDFTVEEIDIVSGLMLIASGYDSTKMNIYKKETNNKIKRNKEQPLKPLTKFTG